jgi:hypothetical protein
MTHSRRLRAAAKNVKQKKCDPELFTETLFIIQQLLSIINYTAWGEIDQVLQSKSVVLQWCSLFECTLSTVTASAGHF